MSDLEARIPVTLRPLQQTRARLRRHPASMVKILGEGDAEIFAILSDGTVRGAIEDAGPAAQRFMNELRGMAKAIRAESLREAADEFERLASLGTIPNGQISDTDRAEFWAFAGTEKSSWLRARANNLEAPNASDS